jgi:hypothetical protein
MRFCKSQLSTCALVLLLSERQANAYTDPGSGALLWQLLMGAAIGCMFYFRRIISWFSRKKETDDR